MALTYAELESVTEDWFLLDNGKAVDIYFNTSFLLNYLMKQQKGLWERPPGGMKIMVPVEYDEQVAEFYARGETTNSDDRESVNSAFFDWKHSYGNATVYRIDMLKNDSEYGQVKIIQQRVSNAQKSLTKLLAGSVYDAPGGSTKRLTGLRACCNATTTTAYGGIQEADLVSVDGSTMWKGRVVTTATALTLNLLRTGRTTAKLRDGANGKPDLIVTTETNWNTIADILQAQQRFTEGVKTAKAGFSGLHFEGADIFPDDFCPASHMFFLNSSHIGFAVHKDGYFMRTKWDKIPDSPEDKTMKIYWDGNMIVNNRKAHLMYSSIS
jgi:hypothetical protein